MRQTCQDQPQACFKITTQLHGEQVYPACLRCVLQEGSPHAAVAPRYKHSFFSSQADPMVFLTNAKPRGSCGAFSLGTEMINQKCNRKLVFGWTSAPMDQ